MMILFSTNLFLFNGLFNDLIHSTSEIFVCNGFRIFGPMSFDFFCCVMSLGFQGFESFKCSLDGS